MGEGKTDVGNDTAPVELEREVEAIRADMTEVVSELDRRRHDFFDWRLQLRRHARAIAFTALGALFVAGAAVGLSAWRRKRNARPLEKARRLRDAVSRMIDHPELVARPHPNIAKKAFAAAVSSAAGVAAKKLAERVASQERDATAHAR